jgi:exodeoxyribonuclease VII small subunit
MVKAAPANNTALENLSFEDALSELETIVRQLESGTADLKSSIDSYERGMALKKLCETKLKEAQAKIEKITVSADGKVSAEKFNLVD